ncbi:MAG TPA: glycoside hydrolase family 3 C-terminal domain-containing protein [Euzebyales bacterium]
MLLRNDGGVLPLRPTAGETLAVIGEFARTPRFQGAGSSLVNPTRVDVPLDELTAAAGSEVDVRFVAGFGLGDDDTDDEVLRAEAVELARVADHVVVFLGLPAADESEGYDRADMQLPAVQVATLAAVADVHDRVVVVLANGAAVRTSTWDDRVAAILECWLSGQAAGGAVADLLLGEANPSGKLAETIPLRLQDNSAYLNFPGDRGVVRYGEGVFVGYRAHDALDQLVSYPFGHGLSYTTFAIDDVAVAVNGSVADGDLAVRVTATVTNTGDVDGAEVVQLYVGDDDASVARPKRELKGARKVWLAPGERKQIAVDLDERAFAFWSIDLDRWVVEAGDFTIAVGASSRNLAAQVSITLDAPAITPPLSAASTLAEWLDDPQGRALLARFVGDDASGGDGAIDRESLALIDAMPMRTLAAFPHTGFDRAQLDAWLRQLRAT